MCSSSACMKRTEESLVAPSKRTRERWPSSADSVSWRPSPRSSSSCAFASRVAAPRACGAPFAAACHQSQRRRRPYRLTSSNPRRRPRRRVRTAVTRCTQRSVSRRPIWGSCTTALKFIHHIIITKRSKLQAWSPRSAKPTGSRRGCGVPLQHQRAVSWLPARS